MWQATQRWVTQVHGNSNEAIHPWCRTWSYKTSSPPRPRFDLAFVQLFLMFPCPTLCAGNVYSLGKCVIDFTFKGTHR